MNTIILPLKKPERISLHLQEPAILFLLFQICVVFSEELKCWCRAIIKSIMYCTDHYQTECFLVDYAKYIFVKSNE